MNAKQHLPIPPGVSPARTGELYKIDYNTLAPAAIGWAKQHGIAPAASDRTRLALLVIDAQVDFCIAGYGLYVMGAENDNRRLCEFIYRNMDVITKIFPTMDTHESAQIFHAQFWVDEQGANPGAMTAVSVEDVKKGKWRVNPAVAWNLGISYATLQGYAMHYVTQLEKAGRYTLMIWPYHCLLGSVGHALVPAVHEALWFHNLARSSKTGIEIKGGNALTENYSIFRPEVLTGPAGTAVAQKNAAFLEKLLRYDYVVIAGQAKSHCVAWTIDDLLMEIKAKDPTLAEKVILLEDCTSPVVVPGVCDFTAEANRAFERFKAAGMRVVRSTDPIDSWPGVEIERTGERKAA